MYRLNSAEKGTEIRGIASMKGTRDFAILRGGNWEIALQKTKIRGKTSGRLQERLQKCNIKRLLWLACADHTAIGLHPIRKGLFVCFCDNVTWKSMVRIGISRWEPSGLRDWIEGIFWSGWWDLRSLSGNLYQCPTKPFSVLTDFHHRFSLDSVKKSGKRFMCDAWFGTELTRDTWKH